MQVKPLKMIIPTTVGTMLEWAEYTFFAYMADELSTHFFSIADPDVARLKTYGVFATSFFMRPLGALLFGMIGDKLGRKPALVSSMTLMCLATTGIGLLPTYSDIGRLAPLFLLFCRLLQGVAIGGEFNGAAVFMFEHTKSRPFLAGCFAPFAASAGMCLGALAATLVSLPNAPDFSWRIPFLCSGLIGIVALYLRQNAVETPVFERAVMTERARFSFITAFKENKYGLLCTASMCLFISVYVYIGSVYYKTLMVKFGELQPSIATQIVTMGQLISAILTLSFGFIADRFNGKTMCLMGVGGAIFLGPFIMSCGHSGDIQMSILGQCVFSVMNGLVSSTMMTLLIKQFKPGTRYTGHSFAWSTSSAIFGGTALLVAESLVKQFGFMGPGIYISLASLIAFLVIWIITPEEIRVPDGLVEKFG